MTDDDELFHFGILRQSGRYPWGSGSDEYARSRSFYQMINAMKDKDADEVTIAKAMGLSVADLRSNKTIAKEQIVKYQTDRAKTLRDKGTSIEVIAKELDIPEPTVRLRLRPSEKAEKSTLINTADVLRKNVDKHGIVDIGEGTELQMGIKSTKLKAAVAILRDEGYVDHVLSVPQVGSSGNFTKQKVLTKPDTTWGEAMKMKDKIHTMGDWTDDDGLTFQGVHAPVSISSKRLKVKFAEEGGTAEDGVVYVRPGVKDLDMGKNTYAQVRILIDDTHYIKGMAVLKDDLPDGVDLLFNVNKSKDLGKLGALKKVSEDPENPFGSSLKRQITEVDPKTGKERAKSAMNIVNEEGDWDGWSNSLPSQMLAKQPHSLIKSQLTETRDRVKQRMDEIESITNPVVRRKAFEKFADEIDSDAVDLRAAAMPRQQTLVILPFPNMKKDEVYAPGFETGEKLVLIRYPHAGQFEIPEVTVNNNSRTAKKLIGNARDAIGIHPSVASRLSGADFDGDTVVAIPNRAGKIKSHKTLGTKAKAFDELSKFEPSLRYGGFVQDGVDSKGRPKGNFKLMTNTGLEMGMITNLITDMSVQAADPEHIVRAVKHSMVVIDAEKHKLDYQRSAIENGIPQLKEQYQGSSKSGAKTLLSKATASVEVPERKLRSARNGGPIDPKTGAQVFEPTGRKNNKYDSRTKTYDPNEKVDKMSKVKRLALTDDANTLVRDPADPVERLYATHANEMKAMANASRLKATKIKNPPKNSAATKVYRAEVDDLVSQLNTAKKQKPLDRKAQIIANGVVKQKRQEDPQLATDRDRKKKVERQAIAGARARLGLEKPTITISDRQWDAIQSGAISSHQLSEILGYVDPKRINELAMPKSNPVMTTAISSRAKAMLSAGVSTGDIAAALGISSSTLKAAIQRGDL